ncbi:protein-disulfide isomerase [Microbacterium sp. 1.5R]|nr:MULTISPECIES: thioredoxin domain-containing protein [unclassified Microbacterium]AKV86209.1 protein-disulfide isomerase [Microbacterium sp. CGR1]APH45645.1 protein-disulfide isomerase [Microbacterium sp. 1.5R]KRD50867.1 protein-disulfide isomerase [Microbacterium sp. Root280D1]MDY0984529.1 thioredoxin domain-containing protein [Microbacterium sp. CFBP9023]CAH0129695.1 Serine/threonine-protein kinase PknE [Microbacterium sp. Bi98]
MSSDETPNVPSPRNSREVVREKAQKVHAQQSRARVMRRIILGAIAVVAVGAIGTAITLAVSAQVSKPQLTPGGMNDDGILVSDISASAMSDETVAPPSPEETEAGGETTPTPEPTTSSTVDIHIYVDYLSPDAGEFERANARQLVNWISEGAATVTYHPVALLTASSNGTKYSLRSAAAAACVATHSPAQFYAFNHDLLDDQPEVNTDGFSDSQLADIAGAVGSDNVKSVRSCIEDQDYVTWAKEATSRALEGPLVGSDDLVLTAAPMIVVNGEAYVGALDDPSEFSQFVLTVASDAYYATETPTPAPTETTEPAPSETPAP